MSGMDEDKTLVGGGLVLTTLIFLPFIHFDHSPLKRKHGISGEHGLRPSSRESVWATAARGSSGSKEEKSLLDWILGGIQKNQLLETDPILEKVEEKASATGTGTGTSGKNSVSIPPKKKGGGFGRLFSKNN